MRRRDARGGAIGDVSLADVLTMRSGLAANDSVSNLPGKAKDWALLSA